MSEEDKEEEHEDEEKVERRRGPSTYAISFSGIIAVATLAASGVATYNAVQNDIASLKRGEIYQERTNERLAKEIENVAASQKEMRSEQRETMREFNDKLDRVIEVWPRNGRKQ